MYRFCPLLSHFDYIDQQTCPGLSWTDPFCPHNCPFTFKYLDLSNARFLHSRSYPKRHLDRFSFSCKSHGRAFLYFTIMGHPFPPQNCPFTWGFWTPSNTWFLWPTRVLIPIGISFGLPFLHSFLPIWTWQHLTLVHTHIKLAHQTLALNPHDEDDQFLKPFLITFFVFLCYVKADVLSKHWYETYKTSGDATWFTAGGAIRIAHYDVIDDVVTRKL